ncbi:hypothetical protein C2G38_1514096 [Gigaspora rosea]|uniref:Uncharacterized protein n=1 Tax=Gigaspora rosea TaxID=44941 RepID=A0A397W7S3_9GLOM|nr:hypothetical protein C2G38_1514096 [Gigaspora rosea]
MNLFIGILSNLISNSDNQISYLTLKSEIIEEIELFYMFPHQRRKNNWFPYIMFYECHTTKLYEHIIDIQSEKLSGYKKIFISKNLMEVLQLPEEEPSLIQIEKKIEKNEEKQEELHILKEIEKTIKDLPVLKQEIKELKESIEVMKTNK